MDRSGKPISELRERIKAPVTREACDALVTAFDDGYNFKSRVGKNGFITDFRIETDIGNCFAFTANQKWLLCYFRAPALTAGKFSGKQIQERFPNAEFTGKNEWKLRVHNKGEAMNVVDYARRA